MRQVYRILSIALLALPPSRGPFAEERTVIVAVVAPAGTPADAQVCIAGNIPAVGNWDPAAKVMDKQNDSLWTFTVGVPEGTLLEFKITRGSWSTEAVYDSGGIPPNTQLRVLKDTTLTLRPIGWSDRFFVSRGGITGTVRYLRGLEGEGLAYARDVIVWLPPSYEADSTRRYPVLYMHDGQNIIDPSTSFIGYDWRVDEVSDSLIREGKMKEVIVVGIYNSPHRMAEYDDTEEGTAYMHFIVSRLKPMIDSNYRTLPDREHTSTMGSSMGGLISFLLAWNHPEVFSQAACLSPVFRESILDRVASFSGPPKGVRLYIDDGGKGLDNELLPGCERMVSILGGKGFERGNNLEWFYDETAEHNERAWAHRLWRPLLFMSAK